MKVVIAVNYEELESYISNIEEIEKSEIVRHKKNLIKACDELKPDVVFISNTLSGEEDIRQIINKLTGKEYTGIRIIYLYGEDDRERKKFINYLISRGIYDYHIGIEITPGDIQRLLFNPRTREQIKHDIIDDNESIENTENIEVMKEEKEIRGKVEQEHKKESNIKIIEKEIVKEKIKGTLFIVFAGADTNIGCTHAAYSTAYYLSRQGYKTAYIEMCDEPIFFKGYKDDKSVKEIEGGYTVDKNLDLYVKYLNGRVEYGKAVSNGYTYIVIDLGCIFRKDSKGNLDVSESIREMERANVPILVGGGSKWQLEKLVHTSKFGHDNWKLYINFVDKEHEKDIKKTIKDITNKEVYCAPYIPNCFKRYEEYDVFVEELLKEILPAKSVKKPGLVSKIFSIKNRR